MYFHEFFILSELVENTEKTVGGERQRNQESAKNKKIPDGKVSQRAIGDWYFLLKQIEKRSELSREKFKLF